MGFRTIRQYSLTSDVQELVSKGLPACSAFTWVLDNFTVYREILKHTTRQPSGRHLKWNTHRNTSTVNIHNVSMAVEILKGS